ncbi:MAG: TonB-dependent receptor, partial [Phenylobacterium sp.]|nr:TonB-dependent receptor [Phenylobacterium sp.]
ENIQDVPLAVSAYSGEQMRAMNIQDATRIVDLVPNFKAGGLGGPSGPPFFSIRGVSFVDFSNINEASVALYVDEVYQASQGIGVAQVYDLEHVEVLRGPQGTLFGRNATAGVVSFLTRKPTDHFEGYASAQYGTANQTILEGAVGGPLAQGLRARAAFKWNRDDGWQRNQGSIGGRDAKTDALAGRITAQWDITSDWMLEAQAHYSRNNGISAVDEPLFVFGPPGAVKDVPPTYCPGRDAAGNIIRPVPGAPSDQIFANCIRGNLGYNRDGSRKLSYDPAKPTTGEHLPFRYRSWGAYGKITGDLGWGNFTSITAYEHYHQVFAYDIDSWENLPFGSGQREINTWWDSHAKQFSQEARVNGEYNGTKWVGGVYFYKATQESYSGTEFDLFGVQHGWNPTTHPEIGAINAKSDAQVGTQSYAAFGQIDAPVSSTLTASVGLRYTNDRRKLERLTLYPVCGLGAAGAAEANPASPSYCGPTARPSIATQAATGRAALEWRPGDQQLYFAQYSHGFKSGGYNPNRAVAQRGPVDAEQIDSFELGMKRYFFDRTLRLNASVFYYKFKGLQALVGSTDPATGAINVLYINAGDPRTYGAEFESTWAVTDNLEAQLNLGLLNTKIIAPASTTADGRPLNGKHLSQAPDVSLNAIIRYTLPLDLRGSVTLQGDGRWQAKSFAGIDNDPAEFLPSYGVMNLRAQWRNPTKTISFEVFVENVLDQEILQHVFEQTPPTFVVPITATTPSFGGFRVVGQPRHWGVKASYDF